MIKIRRIPWGESDSSGDEEGVNGIFIVSDFDEEGDHRMGGGGIANSIL